EWFISMTCSRFRRSRTWLLVSPGRGRKSEQLSLGTHHGFIAARRSHERCQLGAGNSCFAQNSRSAGALKSFTANMSTTFREKLFTTFMRTFAKSHSATERRFYETEHNPVPKHFGHFPRCSTKLRVSPPFRP